MRQIFWGNSGRGIGRVTLKILRQTVVVFLIFLTGTLALVHVDRQCAIMDANTQTALGTVMEKLENFIEK